MTLDLDALEALADAATPGPWKPGVFWHDGAYPTGPYSRYPVTAKRDAAFIAASRTAIPELIAEVRGLRAVLTRHGEELTAGWRDRAEAAQAEVAALREALGNAADALNRASDSLGSTADVDADLARAALAKVAKP